MWGVTQSLLIFKFRVKSPVLVLSQSFQTEFFVINMLLIIIEVECNDHNDLIASKLGLQISQYIMEQLGLRQQLWLSGYKHIYQVVFYWGKK